MGNHQINDFSDFLYDFLRPIGRIVPGLPPFRSKVYVQGKENLPEKAILASNHTSYLGPFFISCFLDERIYYIVTREFRDGLCGMLLRFGKQIILDNPRNLLERSREVIDNKGYLGIFPEGKITVDGEIGVFKTGVEKISRYTKTPVVPIGIEGPYKIWPIHKKYPFYGKWPDISIKVGTALDYNTPSLTEKLRKEVVALNFKSHQ